MVRVFGTVLAALLVGVFVRNWALAEGLFRTLRTDPWSYAGALYVVVVGLFLALLIGSIIGLLRVRPWGFYCAYALVPVSTILQSIPLVPFVSDLLPNLPMRIWAVFTLNLAFLAGVMLLHWSYRKPTRDAASVGV